MTGSLQAMTAELRQAADDEAAPAQPLEAVVAGMGEALVAVDDRGRVTDFNAAAEELLGVRRRRRSAGRAAEVVLLRATTAPTSAPASCARRASWTAAAHVVHTDGTEVPVAVSAGPLRGPAGELAGAVFVLRDLRREREVERMKTEFLSNICHELRTPLTPIKGYAEILRHAGPAARAARRFANEILSRRGALARSSCSSYFASLAAGRLSSTPSRSIRGLLDGVVGRWATGCRDGHRAHPPGRRAACPRCCRPPLRRSRSTSCSTTR